MEKKCAKGKEMVRKMYFLNKKREKKKEMKSKNMAKRGRGNYRKNIRESRTSKSREERVEENRIQMEKNRYEAKKLRKEKEFAMKEKLNDRYGSDQGSKTGPTLGMGELGSFFFEVSYFFAECLRSDIELLNNGESMKISLAAKWCPSVDSSYDKALLICESVARLLYPWDSDSEFEALDEFNYIVKIKSKLRKEVLVPLRNALMLPEVYMSAKQWSSITYERVASIAMKNYTNIFLHRDNERFRSYLEKVKHGDAKIAAGALLPDEIIKSLECGSYGSMYGTPMEVCVALGLLVSELSEEPWKDHVITFSQSPQLHLIEGPDLRSKTEFIKRMDWGMNTNLQKVFDKMLEVAVENKLSEDEMVRRVFVFSDMEFDEASATPWETDYEAIQRKFRSRGYEKVPEIVFWNLRDSRATPVTANQKGVALLSGFSKNLLTLFLEGGGMINPSDGADLSFSPVSTMDAAISGELYQKLVVCD
ncbi:putative von Willebrand factor A-like domain superfamily protein [Tanacetum coccineum]